MFGMVLHEIGRPLVYEELPDPVPGPGELRVRVEACGVCRTDLHVVDGELPDEILPIIPGHEIVGRIDALGPQVEGREIGERVGIPWLGSTCGVCPYCVSHRENLCDRPVFTGYTRNGGYATRAIADARYAFRLSEDRQRRRACAFALCRPHRLALAKLCGQCKDSRPLWLRGGGSYHRASRAQTGAPGFCLHAPRRRGRAILCLAPRCRLGRKLQRKSARTSRRGDHLCARLENWCLPHSRRYARGALSFAPGFT